MVSIVWQGLAGIGRDCLTPDSCQVRPTYVRQSQTGLHWQTATGVAAIHRALLRGLMSL